MTPNEDFLLDFLPGSDRRVAIAAGFSGHGFKLAPLVGKIMAELATKGPRGWTCWERCTAVESDALPLRVVHCGHLVDRRRNRVLLMDCVAVRCAVRAGAVTEPQVDMEPFKLARLLAPGAAARL